MPTSKERAGPSAHGYYPREFGLDRRASGKLGSSFVDGSTTPPAPASSSQRTAERPSGTAPPSAMVLFPACRARAFSFVWRHGGECRGGGADVCYEATATSLSGGAATDRVSGFGAGSTRDMAKNGFGEAAIDADVLPRDVAR